VQKSVTGTISGSGATVGLATLTELLRLTTKGTLVDTSILGTREWATITLKLANTGRGLAGHVVNSVLVTKPIGTLHGIVHVPSPVILVHAKFQLEAIRYQAKFSRDLLSKSSVDTTLGSDSVTSCGEQLGDTSSVESSLGQTEGSAQTGTTGTDNDGIVLVVLRKSDPIVFLLIRR
jgi:hypothetical protein